MTDVPTQARAGVDPERLRTARAVFGELDFLPVDHPDAVAVREATARLFKQVRERRRRDRRDAELAHDAAITPPLPPAHRVGSTTRPAGLPLSTGTVTALAGTLRNPRACYTCLVVVRRREVARRWSCRRGFAVLDVVRRLVDVDDSGTPPARVAAGWRERFAEECCVRCALPGTSAGRSGLASGLVLSPASSVQTVRMRFPIDVPFVRRDGRVSKVVTMRPNRLGSWRPRTRWVLETDAGRMAALGIRPGSALELDESVTC